MKAVVYEGPRQVSFEDADERFDRRDEGWHEVLLKPGLAA